MKNKSPVVFIFLVSIALILLQSPTLAASAALQIGAPDYPIKNSGPIHVDTEPGGDIDLVPPGGSPDGVYENVNGTFIWNGSKWFTDDTAAHTYFTDAGTGERLKNYTLLATLDGSGMPGMVFNQWGYMVNQSTYNYSVSAANHTGFYHYQAVQYSITTLLDREKYIIRSRGSGNGTGQGYLDIYIQEDPSITVAFRGDPFMFAYNNTTAEQALLITSETQGLSGILPTYSPSTRAQYWLDINGGSDLGGASLYFRTSQIAPIQTRNLESSFPTEFRIKFMDGNSALEEFMILPRIVSETFLPNNRLYLPLIRR